MRQAGAFAVVLDKVCEQGNDLDGLPCIGLGQPRLLLKQAVGDTIEAAGDATGAMLRVMTPRWAFLFTFCFFLESIQ